jgi:hypothetical protein
MTSREEGPPASHPSAKREYAPPKLEKLGSIRELTRGIGMTDRFDNTNPPGQNKSQL